MYLAVKAVCDRNSSTIATLPAFADGYTEFGTRLTNIQTLAQNQAVNSTGLAADKQQLRKDMAATAATIAKAVYAYAKKVKNNDLAAQADVTASSMTTGRDTAAADLARNVHAAATANLANLAPYGVTAAKLTDFKARIDAYAANLSKPRDAVASSSTATRQLAAEFAAADDALNDQMDALILQFTDTDETFVADYKNARIIVDNTGGKAKATAAPAPTPP
jgi:hypothetical protein